MLMHGMFAYTAVEPIVAEKLHDGGVELTRVHSQPKAAEPSEFVTNWRHMTAMWIVFFVTAGVTYVSPPIIFPLLMKEFKVDALGISLLPSALLFTRILCTLPGGFVVNRFGPSRCIQIGSLILAAASSYYPFANSLHMLAVVHCMYGLAFELSGLTASITFLTSWFAQKRGFAIGILVSAFGCAGIFFPPVVAHLAAMHGWRYAVGIGPVLMFAIVVPLTLVAFKDGPLISRDMPAEKAVHKPLAPEEGGGVDSDSSEEPCCFECDEGGGNIPSSFVHSITFYTVWHLVSLSFCVNYIVVAFQNTLVLYLHLDAGLSLQTCGFYSSVVFIMSVFAKLVVGAILDTSYQSWACLCSYFALIIGVLMPMDISSNGISPTTNKTQLVFFAIVYGFGYGAAVTVMTSKAAKLYGSMNEFSKLQAFLMLWQVIGGFFGVLFTGKLRADTGSYAASFSAFVAVALLTLVHCFAMEAEVTRQKVPAKLYNELCC